MATMLFLAMVIGAPDNANTQPARSLPNVKCQVRVVHRKAARARKTPVSSSSRTRCPRRLAVRRTPEVLCGSLHSSTSLSLPSWPCAPVTGNIA